MTLKARLFIKNGEFAGATIPLVGGQWITIGRSDASNIILPDGKISRVHCKIDFDGKICKIEDMDSRNGTFVNAIRIKNQELRTGDEVRVGDTVVRVDVGEELGTEEQPRKVVPKTTQMPSPFETLPPDEPMLERTPAKSLDHTRESGSAIEAVKPPAAGVSAGSNVPTMEDQVFIARHKFCDSCGKMILKQEIQSGKVRVIDGKVYCTQCEALMVGRSLGQYKILEKIGQGSMGLVFRAEHATMRKVAAIKVLFDHLTTNKDNVRRFLREAMAGAALNHPNIVQMYDAGEDKGIYYIVMELVEGRTLEEIVGETGPLPVEKAMDVAIQIGRALQYAYEKKIVHRDLRPGNIVLSSDGTCKVIDMGTAKSLENSGLSTLTKTGISFGTINFASPEQIFDAKNVDHRADIYSLGSTLYYMVTGVLPFQARSPKEFFEKVNTEDLAAASKLNPKVSAELDKIIQKMMKRNREDRFQTPDELVNDLTTRYFAEFSAEDLFAGMRSGPDHEKAQERELSAYDIRIAKEVQQKLVPTTLPKIPGFEIGTYYKPAKEVGGDYFDCFPIGNHRYVMIVADVSGKGISGAMVMVMVRSVLRMLGPLGLSPKETLIKANRLIIKDMRKGMFVSAVYGILNAESQSFVFASAGHNPPVLWKRGSPKTKMLAAKGMVLGFVGDKKFDNSIEEVSVQFGPMDRIVLYTDGVVEAKNPAGGEYGDEALESLVGRQAATESNELIQAIVAELEGFRGTAKQSDDITIVTFRHMP